MPDIWEMLKYNLSSTKTRRKIMSVADMIALLLAELKDDVIGAVSHEGNTVTVEFTDGTVRTITVA